MPITRTQLEARYRFELLFAAMSDNDTTTAIVDLMHRINRDSRRAGLGESERAALVGLMCAETAHLLTEDIAALTTTQQRGCRGNLRIVQ